MRFVGGAVRLSRGLHRAHVRGGERLAARGPRRKWLSWEWPLPACMHRTAPQAREDRPDRLLCGRSGERHGRPASALPCNTASSHRRTTQRFCCAVPSPMHFLKDGRGSWPHMPHVTDMTRPRCRLPLPARCVCPLCLPVAVAGAVQDQVGVPRGRRGAPPQERRQRAVHGAQGQRRRRRAAVLRAQCVAACGCGRLL